MYILITKRNNSIFKNEHQSFAPWIKESPPGRILIVRLHAIGDVAITLPAVHGLRKLLPGATIDYLTGADTESLVGSLNAIDHTYGFPQSSTRWQRFKNAGVIINRLKKNRYDLVVDLQRNWVTRYIRRRLSPDAWGEFDRFTLKPASERVSETFHKSGFPKLEPQNKINVKPDVILRARNILEKNGWRNGEMLVVLNPAGAWESRQWQTENYIRFGKQLSAHVPVKFLLLGIDRMQERAAIIESGLQRKIINLVNRTSLDEAFGIQQFVSLIVSEDSGLMHLGWVSGVATIALFGSTQHRWSAPMGDHTVCLHSGDLDCGACMEPVCRYGDTHCLTRFTPERITQIAIELLSKFPRIIR
ncbi:MAG: glycosyltransferase family 9 protein [Bacteroidota bacterium]